MHRNCLGRDGLRSSPVDILNNAAYLADCVGRACHDPRAGGGWHHCDPHRGKRPRVVKAPSLDPLICVALTVWSAANAYSTRQGAAILAAQTAEQKYEAARADEEEARKTLGHITEVGDAGEFADMKNAALAKLAQACKRVRSEFLHVGRSGG